MPTYMKSYCGDAYENFHKVKSKIESHMEPGKIPVCLVYCMQNYRGYQAFRLNNKTYGGNETEPEFLLQEGIKVYVIGWQKTKHLMRRSNTG